MAYNNLQILNFNHNIVSLSNGNILVITDNIKGNSISIPEPITHILQINSPGPQGPAGPSGSQGPSGSSGGGGNINTGSFATTGSNTFSGTQTITGSVNITGSLSLNGNAIGRPYKVYTALLTQDGDNDEQVINTGTLTIGVTYKINDNSPGMDFTNIGAPNNTVGTYFVATGTTPNSWGADEGGPDILKYNTGAPTVNVLENTLGNVYWEYDVFGVYTCDLSFLSPELYNVVIFMGSNNNDYATTSGYVYQYYYNASKVFVLTKDNNTNSLSNGVLNLTPIEIRVYN